MKPHERLLDERERTMVESNISLVYHIVYRMLRSGKLHARCMDDAIGEGMYGLIRAAMIFDPSRGFQFSTLAARSIEMRINNYIAREVTQTKYIACSMDDIISEGSGNSEAKTWEESIQSDDDIENNGVSWLADEVRRTLEKRGKGKSVSMLLDNVNGRTIAEIACEYGVTKQRIQKQISDAKKILQGTLNRDEWR